MLQIRGDATQSRPTSAWRLIPSGSWSTAVVDAAHFAQHGPCSARFPCELREVAPAKSSLCVWLHVCVQSFHACGGRGICLGGVLGSSWQGLGMVAGQLGRSCRKGGIACVHNCTCPGVRPHSGLTLGHAPCRSSIIGRLSTDSLPRGGGAKGVSAWQVVGKSPLPGCVHMARSRSPRSPDAVTDSDRTTGSKGMCIQSGRRPHVCAALVEQTETELGLGVWSFRRRCLDFDKHRPMWSQSAGRCVETTSELLLGVGFERGVGPKAGSLERERERAMFEALPGHNFRVNHGRCVFIEFAYPCPSPVQVQQAARQSAKRFGTSPLWDSVSAVSFAKRILEQRIAPQFCGCARCIQLRPTGF